MRVRKAIKYAILLAAGLASAKCGNGGKSSQISMTAIPSQPFVITGDFTNPISAAKIAGPWFQFSISVNNNSDEALTIIGLQVAVTANTTTGGTTSSKASLQPSDFNFTLTCAASTTASITYSSFGTIAAGSSAYLNLAPAIPSAILSPCTVAAATLSPAVFYVGGNPALAPTGSASNYDYTVQVTPEGWFGTLTAPTEGFQKILTFTTRF